MKKYFLGMVLVIVIAALPVFAQTEKPQPPDFKLVQFHMALLKRGPQWTGAKTANTEALEQAQKEYATSLMQSGKATIVGRLTDNNEIRGVYVLRAKTADEARAWAEGSPVVKSGHLVVEMHPWWSADNMQQPATTAEKMETAYLGFLRRGPKWTREKTPESTELQKGHMANINRLAETKKLVVAGPFADDTDLRGIFVFRVATLEEAKTLSETDPAIQAGRLTIDVHPWLVPEGVLPK